MSRVRAFVAFVYDFVVGDDWRLAVGVIVGLAITVLAVDSGHAAWWILPVCVVVVLMLSLHRARRLATQPATPDQNL